MTQNKTTIRAVKLIIRFVLITWTSSLLGLVSFGLSPPEIKEIENRAGLLKQNWNAEAAGETAKLYKTAADYYSQAGEFEKSAECLFEVYNSKLMLNDIEGAEKALFDALALSRKRQNPKIESRTYSFFSLLYVKSNNSPKAAEYVGKALAAAEKSGDDFTSGLANLAAGENYNLSRKIDEMIAVQKKSLEYFRRAGDKSFEARILTYLSYSYSMNNNSGEGISHGNAAVEIQRSLNNARGLSLALIAQADANQRAGNWQAAFESLKEAESLFSKDLDLADKAILFTKLGVHYETYGDMINAFEYFKKAQNLYEQGGDRIGVAELSIVLGQISMQLGDYDNAILFFNKGKTESEKLGDSWSMAMAYERLGQVYNKKNLYAQAVYHLEKAIELVRNEKNVKYREASIQFNLGKVYQSNKDYDSALRYFSMAEETNRNVNNILGQSENLYNIAAIEAAQNKVDSAKKTVEEALRLTDKITDQTANSKLKRIYFSNVFDRYELYISLLMKLHARSADENFAIQGLQAAERSRARSLLETLSLSESDFTKDADAETVRRENEIRSLLNAKADKLTDLLSQNAAKSETDKISGEINELENQLEEIKARLKQNSPVYSAIKNPAPFDLADFQKNVLDDESLLLEFSFGDEESYLWLVGRNEFASFVLPPREQIESKIQSLRELLAAREKIKDENIETYQARIAKADADYARTAAELSRELFGQVAGKFGDKRLIIVPDGKLGLFPASALPFPGADGNEPLLLTNEIIYEPSALSLSILSRFDKQADSASKSLLIFSDPVFTNDDARLSSDQQTVLPQQTRNAESFRFVESLNTLARLGSSKAEADSITEILGAANADSFSGFSANRDRLLNVNAADYKILHFATHGLIDENRPELSGIVLSRFDQNGNKLDEFFRLHDIYGMNLNADLVVLSACNTGIGKEVKGEGLMSLNNAFLSVGAKSVVASLWKVEDGATLELMKNFYQAMADENITPSKALQKAQIKMLRGNRYGSPFYWAAFTAQGDYRNAPQISGSVGKWKYFLPAPFVLLLLFLLKMRITRRRNRN